MTDTISASTGADEGIDGAGADTSSALASLLDEWHAWRSQGIGGSDVAAVLGLSQWTSPYSLWAEKVGLTTNDATASDDMEFGKRSEAMNAKWFEDKTGLTIAGEQTWCTKPDEPHMRCTVDGFVYNATAKQLAFGDFAIDEALGVFEAKKTADSPESWAVKIPDAYACQATWNMLVTGTNRCWFGVLHVPFGRVSYRVYEFGFDHEDAFAIWAACNEFWTQHVLTGLPPAIDGSDATTKALNESWTPDPDKCVEAPDLATTVARINANKVRIKECKAVIDAEENAIRAALGDATTLTSGVDAKGRPIVLATWTEQTRAAHIVNESTSRVLRVKQPKGN